MTQGCSEHIINEGSPCANDFAYYGNPGNADGSPLVAPFDCWVFENINHLSLNNGYGNNLVYCVGKYYTAIMTHLHGYYNNVDTFVKQGTPIAKMGGSDPTHDGYTTGLHVHTEIWQYCNNENPTTIAQAIARRCSEAVDPKI